MFLRIVSVILITVFSVSGQELSLADAVTLALENNYTIRIQKADQRIAELNNAWGNAGRFPTIDLDFSLNNRWNQEQTGDNEQRTLTGSVTLGWLLFDGFAINIRKSRFEELENLSAGNTAVVVENTLEAVILAYYDCLLQREKTQVLQTVMDLSQDRYEYEQERHDLGSQTRYELLQAQNAFLEDKSRYLQQRTLYRNSVRNLNYLMGVSENIVYEFTDEFQIEPEIYDLDALKNKMLSNNQTLKNQYLNQSLLEKQVDLRQSEWWPQLRLRAGYEDIQNRVVYLGESTTTFDRQNSYASLTLSWNLFNGGNRKRAIEIAKVDERAGEITINDMKHSLSNRLYNTYELYEVRKELFKVASESLDAAELNLNISEEKFRAGVINSFNYRDVQLIYQNAAVNRLNTIYNLIEADQALLKLTGGMITEYGETP